MTDKQIVKDLCQLVCAIRGLAKGSLTKDLLYTVKSQEQKFVMPRMVVSNVARIHNRIHPDTIAYVLGKHRTTILAYRGVHENQLQTWHDYRMLFEKVLQKQQDLSDSKTQFSDVQELRSHLINAGVIFSNDPNTFIDVNTGKFTTCINTDLKNVGSNMEIIRIALQNYKFESINLTIDEKFIK